MRIAVQTKMKESSNYCYNHSNIGISARCGKKYSKNILDIEYLFVIKTEKVTYESFETKINLSWVKKERK